MRINDCPHPQIATCKAFAYWVDVSFNMSSSLLISLIQRYNRNSWCSILLHYINFNELILSYLSHPSVCCLNAAKHKHGTQRISFVEVRWTRIYFSHSLLRNVSKVHISYNIIFITLKLIKSCKCTCNKTTRSCSRLWRSWTVDWNHWPSQLRPELNF